MADEDRLGSDWRERLAQTLDLPRELVFNLPRIVVIGHLQLMVENHRGLVVYRPDRLVVAVQGGRVELAGRDLRVPLIDRDAVAVNGRIDSIHFRRKDAG